ncbi:hypothetical protein [Streptomyces arenae]|uniref:hypothetical protein n=1 Tax=Streptomyces arenae TaxID=29301 RepID=UPI00265B38E3|nr:hypothetical protein [Streptomyces arenae]MCG7206875.1 hypothetical protein [Streptomyces arenae]
MLPTHHRTAWDDSETRRAWAKLVTCAFLGQLLWPAAWLGLLAWYVSISISWTLWLFFVPLLYTFYRAFLQPAYISWAFHTRRLLRAYPWQVFEEPRSGIGEIPGATDGDVWLSFPNPERPDETLPMILKVHVRSMWWRRRLGRGYTTAKAARARQVWFAGDPRFAAVIAVPGPCRLYVVQQRPSGDRGVADTHGASAAALERARRAGVRLPDPDSVAP